MLACLPGLVLTCVLVSQARPTFAGLRLARVSQLPRRSEPPPLPGYYSRGLAKAQGVMDAALADATRRRQEAAVSELSAWLDGVGEGVWLGNITPEYLLVYLVERWEPNHPGRKQPEPGPDAVQGVLSSLSGWFTRLGRVGPYNPVTGEGNPCDSPWVADYRAGYKRLQMLAGYEEVSAVPLAPEKYEHLCEYLMGQVKAAPNARTELVYCRDLLCAQFMFQTASRGFDTGRLGLGDFCDPAQPNVPDGRLPLPPPWEWAAGTSYVLCVRQRGTKTFRLQRAPAVYLQPNLARPALCFPQTLARYVWRARQPDAAGYAVDDYLFRPLSCDGKSFKNEPLSSSAMGARIRLHLQKAEVYAGETNHSFRRGALQAAAQQGKEKEELQALGQIKSSAVLARYLDPDRHLAGRSPQRRRVQ